MPSADSAGGIGSGTTKGRLAVLRSSSSRRSRILADSRDAVWKLGVRFLERAAGYRRGDRMEFDIRASARDLVDKGRNVREGVEAWAQEAPRKGRKFLDGRLRND